MSAEEPETLGEMLLYVVFIVTGFLLFLFFGAILVRFIIVPVGGWLNQVAVSWGL